MFLVSISHVESVSEGQTGQRRSQAQPYDQGGTPLDVRFPIREMAIKLEHQGKLFAKTIKSSPESTCSSVSGLQNWTLESRTAPEWYTIQPLGTDYMRQ